MIEIIKNKHGRIFFKTQVQVTRQSHEDLGLPNIPSAMGGFF